MIWGHNIDLALLPGEVVGKGTEPGSIRRKANGLQITSATTPCVWDALKCAIAHMIGLKLHTSRQCNRPKRSASFVKRSEEKHCIQKKEA